LVWSRVGRELLKRVASMFAYFLAGEGGSTRAKFGVTKKQGARLEQGKSIRISNHRIGQFTRWSAK